MTYRRRTKIICTLGPATDRPGVLEQVVANGMDVARFNFSHGEHEEQRARLEAMREVCRKQRKPVAALLDTKGPEIRLKKFAEGKVVLAPGQTFTLTTREVTGDESIVSVTYRNLPQDVEAGTHILIDDGLIELVVTAVNDTDITCQVLNGGRISDRKGVNVPNVNLSMEYLSPKDKKDLLFGVQEGFDYIAASFTRTADDIRAIRALLHQYGGDDIRIIAKIENNQGVANIDSIIDEADGIMVARGDMGVEIPLEDVPVIQKMIIKKTVNAGKIVITATQMLDSMITHPRPTRAEATDVANAVYDGTSAVMLSGETAAGDYPAEAVATMAKITERAEQDINYTSRLEQQGLKDMESEGPGIITVAISHTACMLAADLNASAIINVTKTGRSCSMISKCRPVSPIICGCTSERVMRQMNLLWGVTPILVDEKDDIQELFDHVIDRSVEEGLLDEGNLVVLTAGVPLGVAGTTNLLKAQMV